VLELYVISSLRYPHPAFATRRLNLPPSTDPEAIERAFSHGEYVLREVQALIRFHRYRSLKKMYVCPVQFSPRLLPILRSVRPPFFSFQAGMTPSLHSTSRNFTRCCWICRVRLRLQVELLHRPLLLLGMPRRLDSRALLIFHFCAKAPGQSILARAVRRIF
jgi:hypothetical protein